MKHLGLRTDTKDVAGQDQLSGTPPDIAKSLQSPTISEVIDDGYSGYIYGLYSITGALSLSIQGTGKFEIG